MVSPRSWARYNSAVSRFAICTHCAASSVARTWWRITASSGWVSRHWSSHATAISVAPAPAPPDSVSGAGAPAAQASRRASRAGRRTVPRTCAAEYASCAADSRGQCIGHVRQRVQPIDQRDEVGVHVLAECADVVVVEGRHTAGVDPLAQLVEPRPPSAATRSADSAPSAATSSALGCSPRRASCSADARRHPSRVAQVEVRRVDRGRIVEHAVEDLDLGHRRVGEVAQPRQLRGEVVRQRFGHPAVPLADEPDEVRAAAVDLGEADRQHRAFGLLLVGHAPAQVDLGERHAALLAQLPDRREDPLDQLLALVLHVAKRRRHEHPDRPRVRHQVEARVRVRKWTGEHSHDKMTPKLILSSVSDKRG